MRSHTAFHEAMQSHLINCGTYKAQPVFVIRHRTGMRALSDPPYTYSVHTCRYAFAFWIELLVCACKQVPVVEWCCILGMLI